MIRYLSTAVLSLFVVLISASLPASASPSGRCLAVAQNAPDYLELIKPASLKPDQVQLTFVGHSTFRVLTPGGITIVTDYAGNAGAGPVPDVATMNHAHGTHYTDFPDPAIKHILRGWNPEGGEGAVHNLRVGDVAIRNVTTDIRHWSGTREKEGNSIFIFEVAGLCIGHLGHLHHKLTPQLQGWIGRLDVVMVPVDGGFTMPQEDMIEVLKDIRARIILPMHYFGPSTLSAFIARMKSEFKVELQSSATVVVSEADLPLEPTVMVLPGY